jgi:hypothetical protein
VYLLIHQLRASSSREIKPSFFPSTLRSCRLHELMRNRTQEFRVFGMSFMALTYDGHDPSDRDIIAFIDCLGATSSAAGTMRSLWDLCVLLLSMCYAAHDCLGKVPFIVVSCNGLIRHFEQDTVTNRRRRRSERSSLGFPLQRTVLLGHFICADRSVRNRDFLSI